jgi:hypothetical protein
MLLALTVLLLLTASAMLASWLYFRRWLMPRPPIGILNRWDVALMLVGIVLIPYLYLHLPYGAVLGLLGLGAASLIYFLLEPLLRRRALIFLLTAVLVTADVVAARRFGSTSPIFFAVNNGVMLVSVVAVTNLWVQGGMAVRDLALLAGGLIAYDFIFTAQLSLMGDLFTRLSNLPFAPMVAWTVGDEGSWLAIGLGDLLLAASFPLVMDKAYGRPAGLAAFALALTAIGGVLLLPALGLTQIFPVMVVLGPLIVLQYLFWRRRGPERTTGQYRNQKQIGVVNGIA